MNVKRVLEPRISVFSIRKQANCFITISQQKACQTFQNTIGAQTESFLFKHNLSREPVPLPYVAAHFLALLQYAREKQEEQERLAEK